MEEMNNLPLHFPHYEYYYYILGTITPYFTTGTEFLKRKGMTKGLCSRRVLSRHVLRKTMHTYLRIMRRKNMYVTSSVKGDLKYSVVS